MQVQSIDSNGNEKLYVCSANIYVWFDRNDRKMGKNRKYNSIRVEHGVAIVLKIKRQRTYTVQCAFAYLIFWWERLPKNGSPDTWMPTRVKCAKMTVFVSHFGPSLPSKCNCKIAQFFNLKGAFTHTIYSHPASSQRLQRSSHVSNPIQSSATIFVFHCKRRDIIYHLWFYHRIGLFVSNRYTLCAAVRKREFTCFWRKQRRRNKKKRVVKQ